MIECEVCLGKGLLGGCTGCGTASYSNVAIDSSIDIDDSVYRIPTYYKKNLWDSAKMKLTEDEMCNAILKAFDMLVTQTAQGSKINSSYMFMLPYGLGKKTAMFTIIQNYIANGFSVAPVVDVASLAIMENNFRLNEKESVKAWRELIESDLVCVYGVDFSARHHTMKLYLNLCSIRGLQGRPTLLFAENSIEELRNSFVPDNLIADNNNKDIGCRLSHPYIFDAVKQVRRTF